MISIEVVQEECEAFLEGYFKRYYEKIELHLDFIEEHTLFETKRDMLYAYDFLDELFQQLRLQHVQFPSDVCNKLYITIKQLYQLYLACKQERENFQKLFEHSFINEVPILSNYKHQLRSAKQQHFRPKLLKELQANYENLFNLYLIFFEDLFLEFYQEVFEAIQISLNTYILYFDAILWQDALKSPILQRYFATMKLRRYNTKQLLLHHLATTSEVSMRYAHLQKILKAYP